MRASSEFAIPRSNARYKIAALMGAVGIVLLFMALQFASVPFLTSSPIERRAGTKYSRIWIDAADSLVGAALKDNRLTIERWSGGSWNVGLGSKTVSAWA